VDSGRSLISIDPQINWRRYPPAIPKANLIPAYVPQNTWNGGVYGDDQILAKTNVKVDTIGPNGPVGDYTPRNQDDKATLTGNTIVVDVTRPRGPIAPGEGYPVTGTPAKPAPTISSLAPNTAVAGAPSPLAVVVTGTNFTQWTVLIVGNIQTPYIQYFSPTKIVLLMDPARSTPGVITVQAWDHSVSSTAVNFTYT